jgi:hypothetical protein
MPEHLTTLDVLIDKSIVTLDLYEAHMAADRFTQANECLNMLQKLTYQAHSIEDHVNPWESQGQADMEVKSATPQYKLDY